VTHRSTNWKLIGTHGSGLETKAQRPIKLKTHSNAESNKAHKGTNQHTQLRPRNSIQKLAQSHKHQMAFKRNWQITQIKIGAYPESIEQNWPK